MVIIPTAGNVRPEVKIALSKLTFSDIQIHVEEARPIHDHESPISKCALNATHTRNLARRKALKTTHSHFLFLDSDVAPPLDVVEQLLAMKNEAAGGWYPARDGRQILGAKWVKNDRNEQICHRGRYVAGRWVKENVFANYHCPWVLAPGEPDIGPFGSHYREKGTGEIIYDPVRSDMAPLGCLMITRDVLELLEFQDGTTEPVKIRGYDGVMPRNDCLQYGVQLYEIGVDVYMSSRVLCRHIP